MSLPHRRVALAGAAFVSCVLSAPAEAAITPTRSAERIARAITPAPALVASTTKFSVIPPDNQPVGISTTPLAGFPKRGKAFGILSTGDVRLADDKNGAPDSGR